MPLYEYECECGHRFEHLASPAGAEDDRAGFACPMCGKVAKSVISRSTFRLKGAWAKEGYSVDTDPKD